MPASHPGYASVAIPTPLRRTFQYRRPQGLAVEPGWRVRVPFGPRTVVGVVVSLERKPKVEAVRIKPIVEVLDPEIRVTDVIFRLCAWAAEYYAHPVGEVFASALPKLIRTGKEPGEEQERLRLTDAGRSQSGDSLARAPAQKRLVEMLAEQPLGRDELAAKEVTRGIVSAVCQKGLAAWQKDTGKPTRPFRLRAVNYGGIEPTPAQAQAVSQVKAGHAHLLYGVTGSGKTEVYLRLIETCLESGKQALVLVPEIGLTPQTVERFRARFDVEIAVLHSGMTDRERAVDWLRAMRGEAGIVLGTRSAVFTPLKRAGIIIVDEEHDVSFKQQEGLRYSARDLAVLRASWEKVPVVLGSATPSLESLHNVEVGKYAQITLGERPAGIEPERYRLVNTTHLTLRDGFSRPLTDRMQYVLGQGQQALVFINRRGYAPVLFCNSCNWIATCPRCDAKLTYHLGYSRLICHHCGSEERHCQECQSCKSRDVSALGFGTQKVEEALGELFPDFPVIRIDRDSTRRKGALESFLARARSGEPAILVGTQLLAKGHHFPGVTLVAILDIDAGFYSSDFRAIERTGQMILQVGGRSGRAEFPGDVVIQTRFAEHPLMSRLISQGYEAFARELMRERKEAGLPPYAFHALIRASSQDRSAAATFLEEVAEVNNFPSVELLGPVPALMEKRAGKYHQQLLMASTNRQQLHDAVKEKVMNAPTLPSARKVRWSVDVDPCDLF